MRAGRAAVIGALLAAGAARAGGPAGAGATGAGASGSAAAGSGANAAAGSDAAGARIDWARGLVIAPGVGVADRHAPSPAVALGTSRRTADEAGKHALAAAVRELPLAAGGTVGEHAGKAVEARLAAAVDAAIELSAEPQTDGAWRVEMAVPIEAVRQALAGPRALPAAGDAGDPVVVVDGVKADPALGWKIVPAAAPVAGAAVHAADPLDAATLWVHEVPAWARSAPHVTATGAAHGRIDLPAGHGTDATLYVIVTPP